MDEANVTRSIRCHGDATSYLWHLQLGHIGHGGLDAIVKKNYGIGINIASVVRVLTNEHIKRQGEKMATVKS